MKIKYLIILLILFISQLLFSQEQNQPSWVYLENAQNLIEKGEYSQAVIEARKARTVFINEKISQYYDFIREKYKQKIEYELKEMLIAKEKELLENDNYPQYHEIMGDLYVYTNMLDQAIKEYKKALSQKDYFEYKQKLMEIKYKLADVYIKKQDYELSEIIYREITDEFFNKKTPDFWAKVKDNIHKDQTLNHVFRIYRIEGIEYLDALYKIGRRNAILQRNDEALFFLVTAAIVWMTYYSDVIKKFHFEFQYTTPADFINYLAKKRLYEYESKEFVMDQIFFFIGYIYLLKNQTQINEHYFNLSKIFSQNTGREEEITAKIEYFKVTKDYKLRLDEFLY